MGRVKMNLYYGINKFDSSQIIIGALVILLLVIVYQQVYIMHLKYNNRKNINFVS
jgi:hypothetical protein